MTLKQLAPALVEFLLADAALAARVGGRVMPLILSQGETGDSIVYNAISGSDGGTQTYRGPSGVSRPRMQFDCYSKRYSGALSLADLVKERLDGHQGNIGGVASDQVYVGLAWFDGEGDDYDAAAKMFRVRRDFFIWYNER